MAKERAKSVVSGRNRHNITMTDETRERAEKLAELDKRSVSNLLTVLVDKEWERLNLNQQTQEEAA